MTNPRASDQPTKEVARLRFESMLRSLDRHAAILSDLRFRASTLLAATGLVASFFSPRGLSKGDPRWLVALAVFFLIVGLLGCLVVLLRVPDRGRVGDDRGWAVTVPRTELERVRPLDEVEALEHLTNFMGGARPGNYKILKRRSFLLSVAATALVLQVTIWAIIYWRL